MVIQSIRSLLGIALIANASITGIEGQTTDNMDVCLQQDVNGFFDQSWCMKLTRPEGCRLGIVNLLFAAAAGDLDSLRMYQASGLDMTMADYDYRAAIHLTAAEGHLMATKFLVEEAKVPPMPRDRWGYTPLDESKRFGRDEVTAYLMSLMTPMTVVSSPAEDVVAASSNSESSYEYSML